MKILPLLLCGVAATGLAWGEMPPTNSAPGLIETAKPKQPEPSTPAPRQLNAKSAPGAQSPNGTNGTNGTNGITASGKAKTKAPFAVRKGKEVPAETQAVTGRPPAPPAAPAKPAAAPKQEESVLDKFMGDLSDQLKLTAEQKKEIQAYYVADAAPLHAILNDPASSPVQEEQQVSDLRDQRDAKVESVLDDVQQRHDFYSVEATYRVALLEAAAKGTLAAAPVQDAQGGGAAPSEPTPAAPSAHGPAH